MEHDFMSIVPNVNFEMHEIKCIMQQILEGCAYIHQKKIMHRDLKSSPALTQPPIC